MTYLDVDENGLVDPKAVEALREQRRQAMARQEQAMEMQQAIQSGQQAAQGAKLLSETDVRPNSALSAVMGGP